MKHNCDKKANREATREGANTFSKNFTYNVVQTIEYIKLEAREEGKYIS